MPVPFVAIPMCLLPSKTELLFIEPAKFVEIFDFLSPVTWSIEAVLKEMCNFWPPLSEGVAPPYKSACPVGFFFGAFSSLKNGSSATSRSFWI